MGRKLNITPGRWVGKVETSTGGWNGSTATIAVRSTGKEGKLVVPEVTVLYVECPPLKESRANARLMAEAGTVANECGLTPSELLRHRSVLVEAIASAIVVFDGYAQAHASKKTIEGRRKAIVNRNHRDRLREALSACMADRKS